MEKIPKKAYDRIEKVLIQEDYARSLSFRWFVSRKDEGGDKRSAVEKKGFHFSKSKNLKKM